MDEKNKLLKKQALQKKLEAAVYIFSSKLHKYLLIFYENDSRLWMFKKTRLELANSKACNDVGLSWSSLQVVLFKLKRRSRYIYLFFTFWKISKSGTQCRNRIDDVNRIWWEPMPQKLFREPTRCTVNKFSWRECSALSRLYGCKFFFKKKRCISHSQNDIK